MSFVLNEEEQMLRDSARSFLSETASVAALRKLRDEGTSILYISHKLEEIRSLCEHATVLRLGKVVATCDPRQKSARELAEMMVGTTLQPPARSTIPEGQTVLELRDLSLKSENLFGTSLKNVSVSLRRGEILGIGGVAGNGQDELLAALSGEARSRRDSVILEGKPIGHLGPLARRRLGLLAAPEERLGHAAAPDMSLTENALLTGAVREKLVKGGFVDWSGARAFADRVIERFDVRTPGAHVAARALSGGNLQKFVIGREIMQRPGVLVVNQPTWGVDASAAAAIRQALIDLAENGAAVILISQDLDELFAIADRMAVIHEGHVSRIRPTGEWTREAVGLEMMGVAPQDAH